MIAKILIVLVSGALLLSAADDKPKPSEPKQAPLTPLQKALIDKTNAQADVLATKYKIADYRKELEGVAAEQNGVIEEACKALGLTGEQIKTSCGVDIAWVDPDSKKAVGRVFVVPQAPPVAAKP